MQRSCSGGDVNLSLSRVGLTETMKPRKWQLHSCCHTFAQKPQVLCVFSEKFHLSHQELSNNHMVSYSDRHRTILYLVLFIKFKHVHSVAKIHTERGKEVFFWLIGFYREL